jgi:hypothetical protein
MTVSMKTALSSLIPPGDSDSPDAAIEGAEAIPRTPCTVPKFFSSQQYSMLCGLCGAIVPADEDCGGAEEAGAPEFIDLITSENNEYQAMLGPGLNWLDETCVKRYGNGYLACNLMQQTEILNVIAYREHLENDSSLQPGIECFALLRKLTIGAFFTSKIGIKYLQYIGNAYLEEFPGCPVPVDWPAQG